MSGYLKRLAARSLGDSQSATVLPVVRSRSPIAEEDQRIGTPGFGRPGFGDASSLESTLDYTSAPATIPPLPLSSPTLNAGGDVVQRKAAGPAVTSEFVTPGPALRAGPPVDTRDVGKQATDLRASDLSPGSTLRIDTTAIGRDHATASERAGRSRGEIGEIAPDMQTPAAWPTGDSSRASRAYDVRIDEREMAAERSADDGPPRLKPSPRAMPSPALREPPSSEMLEAADRSEREPQLVIGRINVEVVPPAGEPKTSTQSRNGPLTAESVSVIGPLRRRVHSSLRLSLKHR
ncbi:MAG TPA: hypothetical protein VF131_04665 [Blastocatellia bacterium]|nr:hypothetical protein [Blastocatellia bacterium]